MDCVFCGQPVSGTDAKRELTASGLETLRDASLARGDGLHTQLTDNSAIKFHHDCRRTYTDKRKISQFFADCPSNSKRRSLRCDQSEFDWKRDCFICAHEAIFDPRHPDRNPVYEVRTMEFRNKILCLSDDGPELEIVKARVGSCIDLVAAEARYHLDCYKQLSLTKLVTKNDGVPGPGRPMDEIRHKNFIKMCKWIEEDGDAEVYSVDEIWHKMQELAGGDEIFSQKWMKHLLKERYGQHIFFANMGGSRKEVVCFADMASHIVNEQWHQGRSADPMIEKTRFMTAAARIVKEDIRMREYNKDFYPNEEDIGNMEKMEEFLVPSLKVFLDLLIHRDLPKVAIGQAIIQAARPRSVTAPIMFGLGVEMDHVFGSKWLLSQLHSLGFSISPQEVSLFKQSVMQDESQCSMTPHLLQTDEKPVFLQFAADNADANINTLDGTGTFHGTGMISWYKRSVFSAPKSQVIRRARIKVSELCSEKSIKVIPYIRASVPELSKTVLRPIMELQVAHVLDASQYYSSLLWRSANMLRKSLAPTPEWINWTGYVQTVMSNSLDTEVDKVQILPLLDLKSSDESTILSVLEFVSRQVHHYNIPCTTITFDQPLYIKAVEICLSCKYDNIVVRLGGFHILMNVVGAIFSLMKGSGIEDALLEVYGPNSIAQIVTGKSISRAIRALNLLDAALHDKLLEMIVPVENEELIVDKISTGDIKELQSMWLNSFDEGLALEKDSDVLARFDNRITQLKLSLCECSRTSRLWIQFMEHMSIVKRFIFAERSGDWEGHLQACTAMLPIFAATGHMHYAKSCRLYVQVMRNLPSTHPWLHELYTSTSSHVVQRTDHVMNGLWSDLTIEQVLMASLKSRGGLTHGKGLTKSVRDQWVHTMHHRASIHESMTHLTGVRRITSEQHVELGKSRRHRDGADLQLIRCWLDRHNPFDVSAPPELRSLSSGLQANADDGVNCDQADEVGYKIQRSLDNVSYNDAKIKRHDQVKTLFHLTPGIKVGTKTIFIDPTILFLRCVDVANRLSLPLHEYFKYELCPTPVSLFKDGFMLKTEKSSLGNKLLGLTASTTVPSPITTVLDGGWLLHKVVWIRNCSMDKVFTQYVKYVRNKFGEQCIIIFDGYTESNTKDHEHKRRSTAKNCTDVHLDTCLMNKFDQAKFLANHHNKQQFVDILSSRLQQDGHDVVVCRGDADTVIVTQALHYAQQGQDVQVVCTDTDVLCLLIHHASKSQISGETCKLIFRKEPVFGKPHSGGNFDVKEICKVLHARQCECLPVIHAWTGTDTTSALYNHGKLGLFSDVTKSDNIYNLTKVFLEPDITQEEIGRIGAALFCRQFGDDGSDLVVVRFRRFKKMISENLTKLDPRLLPPSPRAAHYHSLRVYIQVRRWVNLDDDYMNPTEWGWENLDSSLHPIMTDDPVGPNEVLNFIRCKCKKKDNRCASNQCTCRKHGLKCVDACGGCHGRDCENIPDPDIEIIDSDADT